jgi:thiosulfate dehydrogenase [quinone] large subunit
LGVTFVYAGLQKLTDPQYLRAGAPGYIGRQIAAFAAGSPLHGFLVSVALPHAVLFGALVAWGELAIGIGTLVGLLLRPASLFGLVINVIFFLSATWRVRPYFYGSDIVFAFGWLTLLLAGAEGTGGLALDCTLAPALLDRLAPERREVASRALLLLLGVSPFPASETAIAGMTEAPARTAEPRSTTDARQSAVAHGRPHGAQVRVSAKGRARYTVRRSTSRREFLWGLASGVAGTVIVGLLGRMLGIGGDTAQEQSDLADGQGGTAATATPASGTTTSTSGVIAQASAVANNSAVSFTIPNNGDPGLLVRLGSGQLVAYDATCTHAGCPVQYDPGSGMLICPCHGAEFDPAHAGAVVQGPAGYPLGSVPITVDAHNGNVTLGQ